MPAKVQTTMTRKRLYFKRTTWTSIGYDAQEMDSVLESASTCRYQYAEHMQWPNPPRGCAVETSFLSWLRLEEGIVLYGELKCAAWLCTSVTRPSFHGYFLEKVMIFQMLVNWNVLNSLFLVNSYVVCSLMLKVCFSILLVLCFMFTVENVYRIWATWRELDPSRASKSK